MHHFQILRSRTALAGWIALVVAALSFAANIEGTVQFVERILRTPVVRLPNWLPWASGVVGIAYLTWLLYVDSRNEPLRKLLRIAAVQATQNLDIVSENIEKALRNNGPIGRLAQNALEDARGSTARYLDGLNAAMETSKFVSCLRPRFSENTLVAFLNSYERVIYRLRDAGMAVGYDFQSNGNFREWKRFDTELVSGVWRLISESRYRNIRRGLESSIWKDGIRSYL